MGYKLNHIGIAVKNLETAKIKFSKIFRKTFSENEIIEEQKAILSFLQLENMRIELLEPTTSDSPISKFIEKKGEGIHHISFEIENKIEDEIKYLINENFQMINETPKIGAENFLVSFIHPKSINGVLIEITQKP